MLPSAYQPLVVLELSRTVEGLWARGVLSRHRGLDTQELIRLLEGEPRPARLGPVLAAVAGLDRRRERG